MKQLLRQAGTVNICGILVECQTYFQSSFMHLCCNSYYWMFCLLALPTQVPLFIFYLTIFFIQEFLILSGLECIAITFFQPLVYFFTLLPFRTEMKNYSNSFLSLFLYELQGYEYVLLHYFLKGLRFTFHILIPTINFVLGVR